MTKLKLKLKLLTFLTFTLMFSINTFAEINAYYVNSSGWGCFDVKHSNISTSPGNDGFLVTMYVDGDDQRVLNTSEGRLNLNGVELKIDLERINSNNYAKITYNITNKSSSNKTVSVSTLCNLFMNAYYPNKLTAVKNEKGFTATETNTNKSIRFILKGNQYVTDTDTFWFGDSKDRWNSLFTQVTSNSNVTRDTSMTYLGKIGLYYQVKHKYLLY